MSKNQKNSKSERSPSKELKKEYKRHENTIDQPSEELYVIFLPQHTQQDEVKEYFSAFGNVTKVKIGNNYLKKYCFAYVHFNTIQEALKALRLCDRLFNGQSFKIKFVENNRRGNKNRVFFPYSEKNKDLKYPNKDPQFQKESNKKQEGFRKQAKMYENQMQSSKNRFNQVQRKEERNQRFSNQRYQKRDYSKRSQHSCKRKSDHSVDSKSQQRKRSRSREQKWNNKLRKKSVSQSRSVSF